MRVDVIGRNVSVTPAIRGHAEAKAQKLHRHFDGIQQITFRLSKEDHQHRGDFGVELVVDVVKHSDFVSRAVGADLYALIDQVVHKASRQLTDFKEQLKQGNH
jgi:putative sigma-54 modulation protein